MRSHDDSAQFDRRLRGLEAEIKRLKQFTFLAIGVVIAGGFGPMIVYLIYQGGGVSDSPLSADTSTLYAKEVVVTDDRGRQRVALRVEDGVPGVYLYSEQGDPTARLSQTGLQTLDGRGRIKGHFGTIGEGAGLSLGPKPESPDLLIASTENGPAITLSDENDQPRANLGLVRGEPNLTLSDAEGGERLGAAVSKAGAHLRLSDAQARVRALMRAGNQSGTAIELFDAGGARRASIRLGLEDQPKLDIVKD
ncbi:MAG: hypothetical protein CME06_11925 [Gemmatimonadetes bacterium]|nr:hypothetical protein [Gemmatimonadota bacterium]